MTVGELFDAVSKPLENAGIEDVETVARWIVSEATALPYADLNCRRTQRVNTVCHDRAIEMRDRCIRGEPVQYVVGYTEFFNCRIAVGPGVLIPRPETELLVERALQHWNGGSALDLCTGSGCIPLAMAVAHPTVGSFLGVDVSAEALDWAKKNKSALGADSVRFIISDLFDMLPNRQFDLITANPPYIDSAVRKTLATRVVDYEPEAALFAEERGMGIIRRIIAESPDHLKSNGWLIMEVGHDQGKRTADLYRDGGFSAVRITNDLAGHQRIVEGRI